MSKNVVDFLFASFLKTLWFISQNQTLMNIVFIHCPLWWIFTPCLCDLVLPHGRFHCRIQSNLLQWRHAVSVCVSLYTLVNIDIYLWSSHKTAPYSISEESLLITSTAEDCALHHKTTPLILFAHALDSFIAESQGISEISNSIRWKVI